MLLLPDIRINDHVLSIQEPYTLDGFLIVDFYATRENSEVIIKNENGFTIHFPFESIEYVFHNEMDRFISRNGNCVHTPSRYIRIYNWREYGINDYFRNIFMQCENYNSYGSFYLRSLYEDLQYQGRLGSVSHVFEPIYQNIDFSEPIRPVSFELGYSYEQAVRSMGVINNNAIVMPTKSREYIHEYNYKPEYIPHYMPNEDSNTTLLLGAEIEVDCGGESEEHAKKVLEIICGIDPNDEDKVLENKMYCTHDGSLREGIEFDTMPASLEYHKNEMRYREMFEYLDKHGYKAHDTSTCGLHIHVDRKYLGKSELMQQLTISKILYILEKFNDEICVIARRNNDYSRFVGKNEVNKSLNELYNKYQNTGKRVALNLQHKTSIEFRCFKGTLKYETFILALEFVKDIVDYAKSINIEEIEIIQWNDLMNTFSDELKEYYNVRLEKEKNKKENKLEERTNRVEFYGGYGTRATAYTLDEWRRTWNAPSIILDSVCLSHVSLEARETPELTTEEKLQREIKSLKKQIKNTNIYLEKKNLQKELDRLQKELKKEKRKRN